LVRNPFVISIFQPIQILQYFLVQPPVECRPLRTSWENLASARCAHYSKIFPGSTPLPAFAHRKQRSSSSINFQQPKPVVRKVYFETIIYENLTTNCKCMLCHCTSKPTGEMAKMFMAIRSGCRENQDLQDEDTNPEVGGRISRSATNGTTSSHRQQQQSQLYQLAEHEEHYAKTMTNSAIRKPSDHPAGRPRQPR
jgi:hypothetical protein